MTTEVGRVECFDGWTDGGSEWGVTIRFRCDSELQPPLPPNGPTDRERITWLYSHANREVRNEYNDWVLERSLPTDIIPLSEAVAEVVSGLTRMPEGDLYDALDVTGLPLAKSCHDTDRDGDCPLCVVVSGARRGERFMRCPKVWPS